MRKETILFEEMRDPYTPAANLIALIVYPEQNAQHRRKIFAEQLRKFALISRMQSDKAWASEFQELKPEWYLGLEQQLFAIARTGMRLFSKRILVATGIVMPHVLANKPIRINGMEPTVVNGAILLATGLGQSEHSESTLRSRHWAPLKPTAHLYAAFIYWWQFEYEKLGVDPEVDGVNRIMLFFHDPIYPFFVIETAKRFRSKISNSRTLNIKSSEQILVDAQIANEDFLKSMLMKAVVYRHFK